MADRSGKTEEPTQRRLQKAREEGQFPAARDFVSALQFLVLLALLSAGAPEWLAQLRVTARSLFERAFAGELQIEALSHVAWQLFWRNVLPLLGAGLLVSAATLAVRLATTRFGLSLRKLAPDPARLNPLSRLRELPGQNLSSLLQAIIMLPMFLWAVYAIAREKIEILLTLPFAGVESGSRLLGSSLVELCWRAAVVFLVFGAIDLFRQLRRYKRDLRM